ncbi:hypothetical protein MYX84_05870 [Acidobacteria bacterium AH-259-O06]|nr:hypothetical protein [Acidobacteria bacterium AH-259-O06]
MPWLHAIDPEQGFDSQIVKDLEVYGIPTAVLVGPNGKILAAGIEKLEEHLEAMLGCPK